MRHIEESCGDCHGDLEQIRAATEAIREEIRIRQGEILELLAEAGLAIQAAQAQGIDETVLEETKGFFQKAVLYWDFVAAENSYGFHNPPEARRVFDAAEQFALQAMEILQQALEAPAAAE